LRGARFSYVGCNDINGVSGTGFNTTTGIAVAGAASSIVSCNAIDDTQTGFNFNGISDNTIFRGNDMNQHTIGLQMQQNGVIGTQDQRGNRWFGPFGQFGAEHFECSILLTIASPIFVDSDESSGKFNFDYLPSVSASGTWFDDVDVSNPQTDIYYCTTTQTSECLVAVEFPDFPDLNLTDELDNAIANGTFITTDFKDEQKWVAKRHLYARIQERGITVPIGTPIDTFINTATDSSYAQFYNLEAAIRNELELGRTDIEALLLTSSLIASDLENMLQIDSAMQLVDTKTADSLIVARAGYVSHLSGLVLSTDTISTTYQTDLETALTTLASTNNLISANLLPEVSEKSWNSLYLESLKDSATITPTMLNTMNGIATLCPLEGGDAVYAARSLYELYTPGATYNDSTLCIPTPLPLARPNDQLEMEQSFTLYPNPVTDALNIRINDLEYENLRIVISDNLGNVYKEIPVLGNTQQTISTSDIKSGVYYCQLRHGEKRIETKRFVIIH
jgi:hypothetical protein